MAIVAKINNCVIMAVSCWFFS